jgi:hypothetical protein
VLSSVVAERTGGGIDDCAGRGRSVVPGFRSGDPFLTHICSTA